ncbi:MAG: FAD:protein FMN transferase [Candidatus Latescibacterota bacterium]|nr:MAG: FAD:protein FMN transferase [Candidatus Latescibacterota bacterium]
MAMDSSVELTLLSASRDDADRAMQAVQAEVERLEALLSDYRRESNVSLLNRRQTQQLAPETRELLVRAQSLCRATDGAFDVSMGPVKRLWGFGTGGTPHVPDSVAVRKLLRHVGCEVYAITPEGRFEWLDEEARIDLGGIAQGYVAGRMADTLRARGIDRFLINVSGDIVVGGSRPDGRAWRIGLQHPRRSNSLLARLPMQWRAVTTSGDYEQSFVADGVRYHHIFDPSTGFPARRTASVSVFSDDPVAADCYATALFVLGAERGLAMVEARSDLAAVFVVDGDDGGLEMRSSADLSATLTPAEE